MKIRALLICSIFSISIFAQNKAAEFKKVEDILERSIGITTPDDLKVKYQGFSERGLKLTATVGSSTGMTVSTGLDWEGFNYQVKKMEEDPSVSMVMISFVEDISISVYENNKLLDKEEDDTFIFYVKTADAKALGAQLGVLKSYTWKDLIKLRTATKQELIDFVTESLNTGLEDIDWKVRSVSDCEIHFVSEKREEMVVPTRIFEIHAKEFLDDYYVLCYGKAQAEIKTKTAQGSSSARMEHPSLEINFEDREEAVPQLEYAIKRLFAGCTR